MLLDVSTTKAMLLIVCTIIIKSIIPDTVFQAYGNKWKTNAGKV